MRVAIIHYWLTGMRGGEKVLEAICRAFPQADIFTHFCDPSTISPALSRHRIIQTRIARLPFAGRMPQAYLPLMPSALEELDLRGYDLVISSEAGPAKGVIAPPNAPHLCYVHSPMRYLWDQYHVYRQNAGVFGRLAMPLFAPRLRQWDVTSAARVDHYLANSHHVAARVKKYWRRSAQVLYPPVDIGKARSCPVNQREGYFLWLGELAPYKRPDIAIEAFRLLGLPLVMIGGPDSARRRLAEGAPPNVQLLGRLGDADTTRYLSQARALVFPGEEDFGMVPVEAMALGIPVIALGRGGACETVIDRETGLLFEDQSVAGLEEAVRAFEAEGLANLDPVQLQAQAAKFSEEAFQAGLQAALRGLGV